MRRVQHAAEEGCDDDDSTSTTAALELDAVGEQDRLLHGTKTAGATCRDRAGAGNQPMENMCQNLLNGTGLHRVEAACRWVWLGIMGISHYIVCRVLIFPLYDDGSSVFRLTMPPWSVMPLHLWLVAWTCVGLAVTPLVLIPGCPNVCPSLIDTLQSSIHRPWEIRAGRSRASAGC